MTDNSSIVPVYLVQPLTARDIAGTLEGMGTTVAVDGNETAFVFGLSALGSGIENVLSYAAIVAREQGDVAGRGVVICSHSNRDSVNANARLVVDDPREAFIRLVARLDADCAIDHARTVREAAHRVKLGPSIVHPSAIVEESVVIGEGAVIGPRTWIGRGTILGAGAVVRAGTVIGEAGAALHKTASGELLAQPHVGLVTIGEHTEIGVNCAIIRGMLGATRIGQDCRIGNFVNVGHGAQIGDRTWLSVGALIGGHTLIGPGATIGMGAAVRDNITIGEGSSLAMGAVVTKSVPQGASAFGNPAKIIGRRLAAGPKR